MRRWRGILGPAEFAAAVREGAARRDAEPVQFVPDEIRRLATCSNDEEDHVISHDDTVNVRYMVDDVEEAIAFYTELLDFELLSSTPPAFADVKRGNLRLLLAGPLSSAGRPMADGVQPGPGGWNRIHFHVDDIDAEVARLRDAGARFRNDIVEGPGGKQILLVDPSGNFVELFEPARR